MRLTWKRAPWSMPSYQPQGRCTRRCSVPSLRWSFASRATTALTSWLAERRVTSTASAVSTMMRSSTPTAATSRLDACTRVLRAFSSSTSPWAALPSALRSPTCHTASHAPRSDQPADSGTMRTGNPLSAAGALFHHRVVDRTRSARPRTRPCRAAGTAGRRRGPPRRCGWRRRCRAGSARAPSATPTRARRTCRCSRSTRPRRRTRRPWRLPVSRRSVQPARSRRCRRRLRCGCSRSPVSGRSRHHAQNDDGAVGSRPDGVAQRADERRRRRDGLVGRRDDEDRVGARGLRRQSGQRHGGRRVPADRLQHDRCAGDVHLLELVGHEEAVLLVADHARRGGLDVVIGQGHHALHGKLEQACRAR